MLLAVYSPPQPPTPATVGSKGRNYALMLPKVILKYVIATCPVRTAQLVARETGTWKVRGLNFAVSN